jgi:ubiquinone/menaquinone biosynthesis C-methylase UbiE
MIPAQHNMAPQSAAADYYDRVAETWDITYGAARYNAHFDHQMRESLKALLSGVHTSAVALELGAGTGPYVEITAPLFAKLIACDISAGMLQVFRRRIERFSLANVTLLQADACDLSAVETASVDVVYFFGLLETVPDYDRLFTEASRVLRPQGFLAGITSNGACPWYRIRTLIEGEAHHARTGHFVTHQELDRALRHAGFASPETKFWGAVSPNLRKPYIMTLLAAIESMAAPTPLARYLGVLSFRAPKANC